MKLETIDFEYSQARKIKEGPIQNIDTKIDLTNAIFEKDILSLNFNYVATYSPQGNMIQLSGRTIFSGLDTKTAYDEWKKTKKITGAPGEFIINTINYSSAMNSIFIARIFGLTPPIIMPTIRLQEQKTMKAPISKK